MKKNFKWILVGAGVILILCIGFIFLAFGTAMFGTRGIAQQGDALMESLSKQEYSQAWSYLHPDLKSEIGDVDVLGNGLSNQGLIPAKWTFASRKIENGEGLLEGNVTFSDGREGDLAISLNQVDDEWLVRAFILRPNE